MTYKSGSKILLFLINPFISAIDSIIHIRDKQSQKLLYCWFLVFGAAFCAVSKTSDSYWFAESFAIEGKYSLSQYLRIVKDYFQLGTGAKDIYSLTVNFIVGQFTSNYHWTFFVYSIIFGIFYINTLRIFLRYDVDNKTTFYFLLFLFCYSNPIFNINGMRFWTASWIGTFVAAKVIIDRQKKWFLLLLITPFIHNAFPIWIAVLFISIITWRTQKLWRILFVLSSFVSAVSFLDILSDYSYLLPQFLQEQVWNYTESEDSLDKISQSGVYAAIPLYAKILTKLPNYFQLLLTYIVVFSKNPIVDYSEESVRNKGIFVPMAAMINFLSSVPSIYRFQKTIFPLLIILWVTNKTQTNRYKNILWLIPIVFAYDLRYFISGVLAVTNPLLYIAPAPVSLIHYLFEL